MQVVHVAVGLGLERVVTGGQLHKVAVLVQQGEDVLFDLVLRPLDGQLVGGGAVDFDGLLLRQGGQNADALAGDDVEDAGVDHRGVRSEGGGEGHRQRPGVPAVDKGAGLPDAEAVGLRVVDREPEGCRIAAQRVTGSSQAVPEGLGTEEHHLQPDEAVELDGVGGLADHETAEPFVPEVEGARSLVG